MASADREGGEELPQDNTCDACEPDEAQGAVQVCQKCAFSFCQLHAEEHSRKYRTHQMTDFVTPGGLAQAAGQDVAGEDPKEEARKLERKKCEEHGEDLSLYCREHEEIICVLCAVSGSHHKHDIITLNDAYEAMRNRDRIDLKVTMLEMVERLKFKCADPKEFHYICTGSKDVQRSYEALHSSKKKADVVTQGDMKLCIQQEFDKVRRLVCKQEEKALHLVDLQEALATAHTTEVLAEIDVRMSKLMTEMTELTKQLDTFNELALLKPESTDEETRSNSFPLPLPSPSQKNRQYKDEDLPPASGPC